MNGNSLEELLDSPIVQCILDSLEEGIVIVDCDCRILFYNKTLSRLEGLEKKDVVNKILQDVFPSITPAESTLWKVMKTGEIIREKFQEYVNYQGREIKTVNTTIPLLDGREIIGALEVSRDISQVVNLTEKVSQLQQTLNRKSIKGKATFSFFDIIGCNHKIRDIIFLLQKVARTTSSVLIYGETGTGKEMFAQSLHNEGNRRNRPFIAQNCAALPESLLEGIMFGTTKGSFTGAADRAGLFEQANGGTVLLDEINSMSMPLQAKILRVLQENVVRRLGGNEDSPIDVRVIATTNENPLDLVKEGRLREDLFYRLSVICIEIPALRERKEDLLLLSQFFINKYNLRFQKKVTGIKPEVQTIFEEYSWPGNVRELEHVIEALLNFSDSGMITMEHLKYLSFGAFQTFVEQRKAILKRSNYFKEEFYQTEKEDIIEAMKQHNGNITKAAHQLGIKRQSLQYRLKKYEIFPMQAKGEWDKN
jgi:arginine utilization regulatory protein